MKLRITVHGVAYEVEVEVLDAGDGFPAAPSSLPPVRPVSGAPHSLAPAPSPAAPSTPSPPSPASSGGDGALTSPVPGSVLELKCAVGDTVTEGQVLVVLETMKMHTSIQAPKSGTVSALPVAVGDTVREGQTLVEFT